VIEFSIACYSLSLYDKVGNNLQKKWLSGKEPYLLLIPAFVLILIFFGYPMVEGVRLAFYHYVLTEPGVSFNGMENFVHLFQDPNFSLVLKNSLLWVVLSVGLQLLLGFILALAMNKQFRGKNLFQSFLFLPWAVSGFLIGMMFKWMFNENNGLVNHILVSLGLVDNGIAFLATPGLSIFPPILAMVWYGVPFFAIMILASLQSIPEEVLEAAIMDGAGRWKRLTQIVYPYIKSTLILTVLLRVIWVFNSADVIYIMTNGGPGNTSNTLASYIFSTAFYTMDFGVASAAGVFMLMLLIIYTIIFFKITRFDKAGDF
jgi:multiple sugar transport system permease protein